MLLDNSLLKIFTDEKKNQRSDHEEEIENHLCYTSEMGSNQQRAKTASTCTEPLGRVGWIKV